MVHECMRENLDAPLRLDGYWDSDCVFVSRTTGREKRGGILAS
jgi:hypothetical protein